MYTIPERLKDFEDPLRSVGYDLHIILSERVLDVGCGFGELVAELQEHNADVYGVDVSAAKINGADNLLGAKHRVKYPGNISVGNAAKLHFPEDYFDAAISTYLFASTGEDLDLVQKFLVENPGSSPTDMQRMMVEGIYRVVRKVGLYLVLDNTFIRHLPTGKFKRLYPKGRSYDRILILRK